ncbi:23379_t:CDS:2 [Gigaspora rosea]|nr:23379_t:CDS:2 [Gigaspora rosea]
MFLLIFITFTLDFVATLRQFEPLNPDKITKGLIPLMSTVEPEPTRSKYRGKSFSGISGLLNDNSSSFIKYYITPTRPVSIKPTHSISNEIPKETQNHPSYSNLENSGIYDGGEITYSWMVLSAVCAFLI